MASGPPPQYYPPPGPYDQPAPAQYQPQTNVILVQQQPQPQPVRTYYIRYAHTGTELYIDHAASLSMIVVTRMIVPYLHKDNSR